MNQSKNNTWVLVGKDGRTHTLPYGMIFIGREECEIILQAVSADKRHAVVYYSADEQEFLIKDLNSLTGTYVNGIRIPEQTYVKLKHLDCIRFGYGPDVFYLEKNAVVLPSDGNVVLANEKIENFFDGRVAKHSDKAKSLTLQNSPLLNRTDLPPDTLSLNLNEENGHTWHDENLSDSPDYSHRSESSSCSAPANSSTTAGPDHDASSTHSSPAAMAFTVAFENEVATPRKKLGIRDSIRKFAPSKPENEYRHSFLKSNSKAESQQIPRGEPKPMSKSQISSDYDDDVNSKVKDAASFLIEKMLNTDASLNASDGTESKPDSKEGHPHDGNDDRSEAGTYTVETENNDGDVEEARKRIDEVFGVIQMPSTIPHVTAPVNSNKQIPSLNGYSKLSSSKSCLATKARGLCDTETSPLWPRTNRALSRGRRLIPAPVESAASGDRQPVETSSSQRLRRSNETSATPDKSRHPKLATSPKSPSSSKTLSAFKPPITRTNNLSAVPSEKNTSSGDDPAHHRSPDNRSDGSKSPHSSSQWRKVPWNLSGSDAELDQSKSENNSVLSDTSTEPSSQSSHSGKNKPEHGPQMRLNRAFALRRARLEADSAKQRGKEGKALSGSQKAMKKSSKLSASTTTLREEGVKTNFRLTPAIAKPFGNKSTVRSADTRSDAYRRKPEIKSGHRRIESDPGKGIPVWRIESRPSTAGGISVCNKSAQKSHFVADGSGLQSFHRSMSCSVMNDAEIPLPVLPCSYIRSFDHSIISGSQIVPGPVADDYQNKKHPNKELTALDSLVISAIHQLSTKLWTNSKALLEKEREKCQKGSDCWLMIEEVLPSMPLSETPEDGDLTKDLSSILKNLKRVEQGLEVLSCVLDSDTVQEKNMVEKKTQLPQNFFIVDM